MIIVCEPLCKGVSHEKINAGFIYGLRLAYPKEEITFLADNNHIQSVKGVFKISNFKPKNINFSSIKFDADTSFSFGGIIRYYFLLRNIFNKVIFYNENKIFFLSTNPIILYVIKRLKQNEKFKNINCTFVLHGELEDVANREYTEPYTPVIKGRGSVKNLYYLILRLFQHPKNIPYFMVQVILQPYNFLHSKYKLVFKKKFRIKKIMLWRHSKMYHYISLSPHVTKNASKFLNTDFLNFYTITMPIIFGKIEKHVENEAIKFAIFGYGDSAYTYSMLRLLSKKNVQNDYEIKIISMDARGTEGFSHINHIGHGRVLTRNEMEKAAHDVDVFLNLYDKTRHRFGCSLSIFESLYYLKPVLHLSNDGYNYFNKSEEPIGYRAETLNNFVNRMYDMIENYPMYKTKLAAFRKNMLNCRKRYNIRNNLDDLRKSFSFD